MALLNPEIKASMWAVTNTYLYFVFAVSPFCAINQHHWSLKRRKPNFKSHLFYHQSVSTFLPDEGDESREKERNIQGFCWSSAEKKKVLTKYLHAPSICRKMQHKPTDTLRMPSSNSIEIHKCLHTETPQSNSCGFIVHRLMLTHGAVNIDVFARCLVYYCNTIQTIRRIISGKPVLVTLNTQCIFDIGMCN